MSMHVKISYEDQFDDLFERIKDKYNAEILKYDGVHPRQMDVNAQSRDYLTRNFNTVDDNSNVVENSVVSYHSEIFKPQLRLNSYYVLWKTGRKLYNTEIADEMVTSNVTGSLYIHDFHTFALTSYSFDGQTPIYIKIKDKENNVNMYDFAPLAELFNVVVEQSYGIKETSQVESEVYKIKDDKEIYVWDGKEYKRVQKVIKHKRHNRLLEIATVNGRLIRVTEDHPIPCGIDENGNIITKPAGELKALDKIIALKSFAPRDFTIDDLRTYCDVLKKEYKDVTISISEDFFFVSVPEYRAAAELRELAAKAYNNHAITILRGIDNYMVIYDKDDLVAAERVIPDDDILFYDAVIEITTIQDAPEYVYDITVEGSYFAANGLYTHNCYAFEIGNLLEKPLPFATKMQPTTPKHLTSFVDHIVQATIYYSNSIAGAVAWPEFLLYVDWFWRKDKESNYLGIEDWDKYLEQVLQSFIHNVNYPTRSGYQSPYTNISIFSPSFLYGYKDHDGIFSGFVYPDLTEIDFDSLMHVQKKFVEVYRAELERQLFTFPVLTAAIVRDPETGQIAEPDREFFEWVLEVNHGNGMFNFFVSEPTALSSCCRLKNELKNEYFNSFGSSGAVQIGSHRVVTVNLARVALDAKRGKGDIEKKLFALLEERLNLAAKILNVHRHIIEERIEQRMLPLYEWGIIDLKRQYSTIGVIGLYEMLEIIGKPLTTKDGELLAIKAIQFINDKASEFTKYYDHPHNVEQVPAESAAVKLAKKDQIVYHLDNYYDLYSNQVVPLTVNIPMNDRIYYQGLIDKLFSGGCILHLNVQDHTTKESARTIIERTVKHNVAYFALNYGFSVCKKCGRIYNNPDKQTCDCGSTEFEHYTRVVGYLTPVERSWNKTRQQEYKVRVFY